MTNNNLTPDQRIENGKSLLALDHPFYATIALQMRYIKTRSVKTATIDGKAIKWNPDWIQQLSDKQIQGLLAELCMHYMMKHHLRRGDRDKKKWNIAGDYAIEKILVDNKFTLPNKPCLNPQFQDMYAEQIYSLLPDDPKNEDGGNDKNDNDGNGNDDSNGNNGNNDSNGNNNNDDKNQQQNNDDKNQQQNNDPTGNGGVDDAPGSSDPVERKIQEDDTDIRVAQAYQAAKAIGKIPGGIEQYVEALKTFKVKWQEVLRDFMDKNLNKGDYTWTRPNRRYMDAGYYLPDHDYEEDKPKIIVCVDTSGSVSQEELAAYASEISGIIEEFNAKFTIIYCDTQVYEHEVHELSSEDMPIKLKMVGGGGTSFAPSFKYITENKLEAKAIIYFTDMYCHDFGKDPGIPVLWLDTGSGKDQDDVPFGKIVKLDLAIYERAA